MSHLRNQRRTPANPQVLSIFTSSWLELASVTQRKKPRQLINNNRKTKLLPYLSHRSPSVWEQLEVHCSGSLEFPSLLVEGLTINWSFCFVLFSMYSLVFDISWLWNWHRKQHCQLLPRRIRCGKWYPPSPWGSQSLVNQALLEVSFLGFWFVLPCVNSFLSLNASLFMPGAFCSHEVWPN